MVHLAVVEKAVGDHTPAHSAAADGLPDLFDVGAQQGLPAGQDHREFRRYRFVGNGVQCFEEILQRHIVPAAGQRAVAAAMAARQVAPGGALPEQIVKFVDRGLVLAEKTPEPPLKTGIHRARCGIYFFWSLMRTVPPRFSMTVSFRAKTSSLSLKRNSGSLPSITPT